MTEMFPGGPQPLIHQAGAPICLPHSLFALRKNGRFTSMPFRFVLFPVGRGSWGPRWRACRRRTSPRSRYWRAGAGLGGRLAARCWPRPRYWLQGEVPPWTSLDSVSGAPSGMMTLIPQWTSTLGSVWLGITMVAHAGSPLDQEAGRVPFPSRRPAPVPLLFPVDRRRRARRCDACDRAATSSRRNPRRAMKDPRENRRRTSNDLSNRTSHQRKARPFKATLISGVVRLEGDRFRVSERPHVRPTFDLSVGCSQVRNMPTAWHGDGGRFRLRFVGTWPEDIVSANALDVSSAQYNICGALVEQSGRSPAKPTEGPHALNTAANGINCCHRIRWVTSEMVRRGSTVRVRQRASAFSLLRRRFRFRA